MSLCYKTSNNKYFDCPARMDDARHFTDYSSNCRVNNILRINNNLTNNFEYKKFLTDNAVKLMDLNRVYACQKNCCGTCSIEGSTEVPFHSEITCDDRTCNITEVNPEGIGVKINYGAPLDCKDLPNTLAQNQPRNICNNNYSIDTFKQQ